MTFSGVPTGGRRRLPVAGVCLLLLAGLFAGLVSGRVSRADGDAGAGAWTTKALGERFPHPDASAVLDDYLGNTDCAECHGDRRKSLATSFHAALLDERASRSRGCESCHGPGVAHWEEGGEGPIRDPAFAPPSEVLGVCLACHADVLTEDDAAHRAWVFPGSPTPEPAVARSCVQCHDVHVDRSSPAFADDTGPFTDPEALAAAAEPIPARRCIECHPTFHPELARSGHAELMEGPPGAHDDLATRAGECGSCHGAGTLHADSGGRAELILNPERMPAGVLNALCNDCHRSGESMVRWTCSEHARENVSCIACHDANARRGHTLRAPEFELCGSCHTDVQASFRLPDGHRVEEGRIGCTDCHDPHGNTSRVRDRQLRRDVCGECHADKSGPFLFDHGVRRGDGCIACHAPHGSSNRRLLDFAATRPLCLQCHPETPHDLTARKYRNCITCHVEIHGSDVDRLFLR